MPAAALSYYLPWHAIDPRIETRLFGDLRAAQPPVVIFRRNELVNGQWVIAEYGSRLHDLLSGQGYAPLDPSSPLLGDILVRQDRLASAREQLQAREPHP
jgi:hypothetical protein